MVPSGSVKIKSLDDLLVHMGRVELGRGSWDEVDLDNLSVVIPVIVRGTNWDGQLDVRGAKFIQNMQRDAATAYLEATGDSLPRDTLIKVSSRPGSNWSDVDVTEIIKTAITHMEPWQIFSFLCLGALCITGVSIYKKYSDRLENGEKADLINNAIDSMREVSLQAIAQGKEPERPIRRYMNSLKREDSISIAGSDFMDKREAMSKVVRPAKDDIIRYTHCDGVYTLNSIDMSDKLPVLQIVQDGIMGKAMFFERVPETVKNEIIKAVEDSIDVGAPAQMQLQIDSYFTAKARKYNIILGIGKPRAGMRHYKLENLPEGVPAKDTFLPGLN